MQRANGARQAQWAGAYMPRNVCVGSAAGGVATTREEASYSYGSRGAGYILRFRREAWSSVSSIWAPAAMATTRVSTGSLRL